MSTLIDRKAYLHFIRNVQRGLVTRTQILHALDSTDWKRTFEIAEQCRVKIATVRYHLKNMEREDIVERSEDGFEWRLAPRSQGQLDEFVKLK